MGERRINPRFNINKLYKNVNIINPYRFGAGGGGGSYDADAQAFIDAVATLSTAQEEAIDDLVSGLKANGTWSKYKAIYPFIGGTASAHKWNLKDPRDLDAAFRGVFYGTVTHSSTGVKGDGSTGFMTTHLDPTTSLTTNDVSLGYYSFDNITTSAVEIGSEAYSGSQLNLVLSWDGAATSWATYDTASRPSAGVPTSTDGYFVGSRLSSTDSRVFHNGSIQGTLSTTSSGTVPNRPVCVMATGTGVGKAKNESSRGCSFATIGDGLTATEVADDYTTIQAYQTALGRNV